MHEIVVADIGGTHARFAIAEIDAGHVIGLAHQVKMRGADHASLQIAWEAYADHIGRDLPREASFVVAAPGRGRCGLFYQQQLDDPTGACTGKAAIGSI